MTKRIIIAVLLVSGVGLSSAALRLQTTPDWPGLFLNIGTGLIGSLVVFLLIDVLLRAREDAERRRYRLVHELRVGNLTTRQMAAEELARQAWLSDADLRGIDLSHVALPRANFCNSDMSGAKLFGANLKGSSFLSADMTGGDLRGTIFEACDLQGANLTRADARSAHFPNANLTGVKTTECNFDGANLDGAKGLEAIRWVGK